MLGGAFTCRTITFLGMPLKIRRAGECGVKPASPTFRVHWTASEMHAFTTKKS